MQKDGGVRAAPPFLSVHTRHIDAQRRPFDMGNQITEIQDQFCSSYDKRKLCSFDIEYIDTPTKPLMQHDGGQQKL